MPEVFRAALIGSLAMHSIASSCSGVCVILSNDVFPSVLFVFKASFVRRKASKHPIFIIHTPKRALVLYRAPSAIRYCQRKQFRVKETFGIFLAGQLHVMLLLVKSCVVVCSHYLLVLPRCQVRPVGAEHARPTCASS